MTQTGIITSLLSKVPITVDEILNSSPSAAPSLKNASRKCVGMGDGIILSFYGV